MWIRLLFLFSFWGCTLAYALWERGIAAWFVTSSLSVIIIHVLFIYLMALRSVEATIALKSDRVTAYGEVTVTLTMRRSSWLPLFWLMIEHDWLNETNGEHRTFRQLTVPLFRRQLTATYHIKNVERGMYSARHLTMMTGDVFGLITKTKLIKSKASFSVYPRVLGISPQFIHLLQRTGGTYNSALRHTSQFSSIREYVYGDPLKRIHWKATARTNALKTRESDADEGKQLLVLLDAGRASYLNEKPISSFEKCVEVAASILQYAQDNAVLADLVCSDNQQSRLLSSDAQSLSAVFTLLCGIRADGESCFHDVLQAEGAHLMGSTSLICVTAHLTDHLFDKIQQLRSRQIQVGVLLVYSTTSLSFQQRYLKQQLQALDCLFYTIPHAKIGQRDNMVIDHVG